MQQCYELLRNKTGVMTFDGFSLVVGQDFHRETQRDNAKIFLSQMSGACYASKYTGESRPGLFSVRRQNESAVVDLSYDKFNPGDFWRSPVVSFKPGGSFSELLRPTLIEDSSVLTNQDSIAQAYIEKAELLIRLPVKDNVTDDLFKIFFKLKEMDASKLNNCLVELQYTNRDNLARVINARPESTAKLFVALILKRGGQPQPDENAIEAIKLLSELATDDTLNSKSIGYKNFSPFGFAVLCEKVAAAAAIAAGGKVDVNEMVEDYSRKRGNRELPAIEMMSECPEKWGDVLEVIDPKFQRPGVGPEPSMPRPR